MTHEELIEKLKQVPLEPGVYLIHDSVGRIIYVGKALILRNRLGQHVRGEADRMGSWATVMHQKLADFEYVVTRTETEALILESTLIKEHQPRFNIRLRDDKSYPYLCLTREDFPRLIVIRDLPQDACVRIPGGGGKYRRGFHDPKRHDVYGLSAGEIFGPYPAAAVMWRVRRLVSQLFGLRQCRRKLDGTPIGKPCLYYHMGQCVGPCTGNISRVQYTKICGEVIQFLDGRGADIVNRLTAEMNQAAEKLDFELAARLRDKIQTITRIGEDQVVVANENREQDLFGAAIQDDQAVVKVLGVRGGKLSTQETYTLTHAGGRAIGEVLEAAMSMHYGEGHRPARHVLLCAPIDEVDHWQKLLAEMRGNPVNITVPQRGERRRLTELARMNAETMLEAVCSEHGIRATDAATALADLADALGLPEPPRRIECYDISNLQGDFAVGSMVVMADGHPKKSDYRRFRIRTVEGQDDFASMAEVLQRRLRAAVAGDSKFLPLPDLIVVDGGKGQLGAALEVLNVFPEASTVSLVGLAKREEEVFAPGKSAPVDMSVFPRARFLLQQIRDEAHRFAVTYHRGIRAKQVTASELDQIAGVGPKRRSELLKAFPSIQAMRNASTDELAQVPGMNRAAAKAVSEYLLRHAGE